ncbi:PQQ-dependent sugar dehydrogenase [Natronoglycomyces albus]|uniref:PQQ-dependent sugar dehydrogenase n=1 Tax=Natronoglycomyces albus TaxID=2811108 RepID=A0A895XVK2_9ACTN|nr:PQQ-dependent sugar dehydrogenase [Natronoglycomyces albus]QSB06556.1 PQQ-dependent sugar dehydrogenase [Natronoglycomyces albus]
MRHRLPRICVGLAATFVLAACSFGDPPEPEQGQPPLLPTPSPGQPQGDPVTMMAVMADNLEVPWGLGFLPDGTALVTERDSGALLHILDEGEVEQLAEIDVDDAGEGGLMGLAVSPEFADDDTVFIYYTTPDDNRIASLDLSDDDPEPEPIVTGIPSGATHNGGQLAFGPDGNLWAATGDAGVPEWSQDEDNLAGKILRFDTSGDPVEDNPFDDSIVYSLGHRNVQGLAWGGDEELYAVEFGGDIADEVNLIEPGSNYGWPLYEGMGGGDEYVDPIITWEPFEASCSAAAFAEETLIVACLRGQRLWTLDVSAPGEFSGDPSPLLVGEFGRLRAVAVDAEGTIWVTTSNRDGRCLTNRGCHTDEDDDRVLRFSTTHTAEGRT